MTDDDSLVNQLSANWRKASISQQDQAMLTYVEKLTLKPWEMEEQDVINLRTAGFNDAAVLDINQVTAYYAFANRLADGLGVGLEPFWDEADSSEKTKNGDY